MKLDAILRIGVKLLLPFILLFGLYVLFHGDFGPGGGFQAGVIAAGMVILYAIVFGLDAAQRVVPLGLVERMIPCGVLVYAGAGLPALFAGRNYLDYAVYGAVPAKGHQLGILIVETGVFVTVAATMVAVFYAFAARGRR